MSDEKEEKGIVSLEVTFKDLMEVEEIIKRHANEPRSKNMKRAISILKNVRDDLAPLAKEKDVLDLKYILDDIEDMITNLSGDYDIPEALEALNSAKISLLKYNLRDRKLGK